MHLVSETYPSNEKILILADFSDRNWDAIQFAMNYLYKANSEICIVQTWQRPNFGSSMVRDLSPYLQENTENELEGLKRKLLSHYSLSADQIHLLPFEGDLNTFFKSKLYTNKNWQVVMALNEDGYRVYENPKIIEVIDKVGHPLYILSGLQGTKFIADGFVLSNTNIPSQSILKALSNITAQNKILFQVCVNSLKQSQQTIEKSKRIYEDNCRNARLLFLELGTSTGQQEFNDFAKEKGTRVMIFDQNRYRKFSRGLKSYLDTWLVRSKGIIIGNY
ncbi:MAG: hypothetical protein COC06_00330 [Bacteroidales bacterium]|nr:MAG: hypothetical protein COC06_00330 [Bacteroidales bacterium]